MAAAKRMYGSAAAYKSMTLELNASDARGIDVSCGNSTAEFFLFFILFLALTFIFPSGRSKSNQGIRGDQTTL